MDISISITINFQHFYPVPIRVVIRVQERVVVVYVKLLISLIANEGLLPSTFTGMNAQKSSYKILLKRDGISPNYVVNGLITTTLPWSEGTKIRYDLLGKAMLSATLYIIFFKWLRLFLNLLFSLYHFIKQWRYKGNEKNSIN